MPKVFHLASDDPLASGYTFSVGIGTYRVAVAETVAGAAAGTEAEAGSWAKARFWS